LIDATPLEPARMTQTSLSTNFRRIERLPAGGLAGFCCNDRRCVPCLRAYREGLALLPVASHKPRGSSLKRQIAAAEKVTGKPVTSVTLPDGTTIYFGETRPTDASDNPWDIAAAVLRKDKALQ
jgi:hypothetical protein